MDGWLRTNLNRLALAVIGVGVFVAGVAHDRIAVATALSVLGVIVLVLAVILPRVQWFRLGPKGIEARLERIEQKVVEVEGKIDQIVALPTIEARAEVFTPTIETTSSEEPENQVPLAPRLIGAPAAWPTS